MKTPIERLYAHDFCLTLTGDQLRAARAALVCTNRVSSGDLTALVEAARDGVIPQYGARKDPVASSEGLRGTIEFILSQFEERSGVPLETVLADYQRDIRDALIAALPDEGGEIIVNGKAMPQLVSSLDFYCRLGLGQLTEIQHILSFSDETDARFEWPRIVDACSSLLQGTMGFRSGMSYGIGSEQVPIDAKRAYEIMKVAQREMGLVVDPEPAFRGVNYDGLTVRYTRDPAPVCSVIRADVTATP